MGKRLNYSFKEACKEVKFRDYRKLNKELMDFLGCKSIQHYYRKRDHFPDIPAHIKDGIEKIFKKYGIEAKKVWEIKEIEYNDAS